MATAWRWVAILLLASGLAGCGATGDAPAPGNDSADNTPTRPAGGRLLAVMVENSPQARPQSGLHLASVVIEAPVEGGITRFLAIFQYDDVPVIGPVRSARPYFVDLARPFDPIYAHCGESYAAIAAIREAELADLDEMNHPTAYWRDRSRRKPHNLYTSSRRLWREASRRGLQSSAGSLPFQPSPDPPVGPPGLAVTLPYLAGRRLSYSVRWECDPTTHRYLRWVNGEPHRDRETRRQLAAETVYLLLAPTRLFRPSTGELAIETTGVGRAWMLRGGTRIEGSWSRSHPIAWFRFSSPQGEMRPGPGSVWVQILPTDRPPRFPSLARPE